MSKPTTLRVATQLGGHVKVRLYYHTFNPKHVRSAFLASEAGAQPPFVEDISVLIPVKRAYNRLSAYRPILALLVDEGLLKITDSLAKFEFREEDTTTLAYYECERDEVCS
jgi:hypothetical protein